MLSRSFCQKRNIPGVQELLHRSGRLKNQVKTKCFFFSEASTAAAAAMKIPIGNKNQRETFPFHVASPKKRTLVPFKQWDHNIMTRGNMTASTFSSCPTYESSYVTKNWCPAIPWNRQEEEEDLMSKWTCSNFSKDVRGSPCLESTGRSMVATFNTDALDGDLFWDRKRRKFSPYQNRAFQQNIMGSSPLKVFGTSFERAQVDYPEMSYSFYSTMRNVMMRADILSTASHPDKCISGTRRYHCNIPSTGSMMLRQPCRTFSSSSSASTPSQPESGKKSTSTGSSSSSSGTFQQASKPPIPVPSPVVHEVPFAVKVKHAAEKSMTVTVSAMKSLVSMIARTPGVMWYYMTHPKEFREKLTELKEMAKKEAHHYYMGSKLLMADMKTARQIIGRTLNGTPLTRRERKQLIRTVTDVFRLVPMSIFVLIPFMEFALPFALKIFPNMLPSTFQDSLKAEENMKRELKSRLAMAEFFQETLQDLAKDQKRRAESSKKHIVDNNGPTSDLESTENREETAASFLDFIEKARNGEILPAEVIIRYAKYFKDELTLDNMPRMQLINMCRYMGIPPYGNDNVLRFQLRHKVRGLIEDDQRILWEGIDSLTKMELREACQERGMRSTGLSKEAYKRALQQWIDLSVNRNVPISLLVMSRTFFLQEEMTSGPSLRADESKSVTGLADAISGLDKELVNEVILETVSNDNKQDPELIKLKLKVLQAQNELIEEEKQQRDAEVAKAEAAKAEKERLEKEKAEKERAEKERAERERVEKESMDKVIPSDALDKEKAPPEPVPGVEDTIIHDDNLIATDKAIVTLEKHHPSGEPKDVGTGEVKEVGVPDEVEKEEEERSLSSQELEAISQLVSPDPVSAEREKLLSLKAALQKESLEEEGKLQLEKLVEQMHGEEVKKDIRVDEEKPEPDSVSSEILPTDYSDKAVEQKISSMDEAVKVESDAATQVSFDGKIEEGKTDAQVELSKDKKEKQEEEYSNKKLDMAISRLKSKVESMVGNLEIQLSDVESKIGDKLHFLDKDMDGILSREEMAICLQSVLKRPLTFEEAMAIATDMVRIMRKRCISQF